VNVIDAVTSRTSCRAFLATPVERQMIEEILRLAAHSPSGGNLQPWLVHVLTGDALVDLLCRVREKYESNPAGEGTEYPIYPANLHEPYRSRRFDCGEALYAMVNIPRDDRQARLRQFARNYQFFGAPVGLFFAIDRRMGAAQWADLGMFMQSVMLLARHNGLDTCPQESWANWHATVGEFLQLPSEHRLFCGMALGYRDHDAPVNQLRTDRAPLHQFATFRGF
jgi:nitroreductase